MKEVFIADTYHELSSQIGSFMEDHDIYDYENVTIVIGKVKDDLANDEYYWKATLVPNTIKGTMQDLLCEEHEIIRHFWCKDDIRGLETGGRSFTEEEVDAIAAKMESRVDCCYGINWDFIDDIAQDVAPDAYAECVEEDDDSDPDEACERDRERHGTDGYENTEEDESDEFKHIVNQYTPDEQ